MAGVPGLGRGGHLLELEGHHAERLPRADHDRDAARVVGDPEPRAGPIAEEALVPDDGIEDEAGHPAAVRQLERFPLEDVDDHGIELGLEVTRELDRLPHVEWRQPHEVEDGRVVERLRRRLRRLRLPQPAVVARIGKDLVLPLVLPAVLPAVLPEAQGTEVPDTGPRLQHAVDLEERGARVERVAEQEGPLPADGVHRDHLNRGRAHREHAVPGGVVEPLADAEGIALGRIGGGGLEAQEDQRERAHAGTLSPAREPIRRMRPAAPHASLSVVHGATRLSRRRRSWRSTTGTVSIRRACRAARAISSAFAAQPSPPSVGTWGFRAWRRITRRKATNPLTRSFTPRARTDRRSRKPAHRRASRRPREGSPSRVASPTPRSAPLSTLATKSGRNCGPWAKSACMRIALSRLGRSVRSSARLNSSSTVRAYPRRLWCPMTVSGSTLVYCSRRAAVWSVEPSSASRI